MLLLQPIGEIEDNHVLQVRRIISRSEFLFQNGRKILVVVGIPAVHLKGNDGYVFQVEAAVLNGVEKKVNFCLLYTAPSPRD